MGEGGDQGGVDFKGGVGWWCEDRSGRIVGRK